jgi:hypothetical protein
VVEVALSEMPYMGSKSSDEWISNVVIDVKARQLVHAGRNRVLQVPAGVSLEGTLARVPEAGGTGHVIRFFPDGSATGASLPFRFRGVVYVLRVNWLTGLADVRRG